MAHQLEAVGEGTVGGEAIQQAHAVQELIIAFSYVVHDSDSHSLLHQRKVDSGQEVGSGIALRPYADGIALLVAMLMQDLPDGLLHAKGTLFIVKEGAGAASSRLVTIPKIS